MGEIKQTNFRVNQETADAFRRFCEENGMSQAQGFDHIMQVVEMDKAKAIVPGRATEIEEFEKAIKSIMSSYLRSIEIGNDAEGRAREQFASSLDRKDKTIDALQTKIEQLEKDKRDIELDRDHAATALNEAEERRKAAIEQMESAKAAIRDQQHINTVLNNQIADLSGKLEGYQSLKESEASLKVEVQSLRYQIKELQTTLVHTKELYETRLADAKATEKRCETLAASEADLRKMLAEAQNALIGK